MKRIANGFVMSLSMFSIIPMPAIWDDKAFCFVIPSFPLVGAVIGGLWFGFSLLLSWLNLPLMLSAALLLLFPLFISGFIHIDGLMDVSDAIGSRAEIPQKRAILKDSHVGAFAVIAFGCYLIIGFSAACGIVARGINPVAFIFIPVLSRSLAGAVLLNGRLISDTGFGAAFRKNTNALHTGIVVCFGVACVVLGYLFGRLPVLFPLLALLLGGLLSALCVIKQLDGISGDGCGFIITASELCALIALTVI